MNDEPERTETCSNCRFWDFINTPEEARKTAGMVEGLCRCHAPAMRYFPPTKHDEWCGEFQPKTPTTQEILDALALESMG